VRSRARDPISGFTLLEVLVAVTILGAGIVAVLTLFSRSLRLADGFRDTTNASTYASQRLEEALLAPRPASGTETGLFGEKFRWVTETSIFPAEEEEAYDEIVIQVTVKWLDEGRERSVNLSAVRWDRKGTGFGEED